MLSDSESTLLAKCVLAYLSQYTSRVWSKVLLLPGWDAEESLYPSCSFSADPPCKVTPGHLPLLWDCSLTAFPEGPSKWAHTRVRKKVAVEETRVYYNLKSWGVTTFSESRSQFLFRVSQLRFFSVNISSRSNRRLRSFRTYSNRSGSQPIRSKHIHVQVGACVGCFWSYWLYQRWDTWVEEIVFAGKLPAQTIAWTVFKMKNSAHAVEI